MKDSEAKIDNKAEALSALQKIARDVQALERYYRDNKIVTFKPVGNQVNFFGSNARTRLLFGSNRSGKSVCSTVEEIAHSLGYRPWLPEDHPDRIVRLDDGNPIPVPNRGYHLLENLKVAGTQVFLPKMEEWLPKGVAKIKKNNQGHPVAVEFNNGSVIHVLSQEQATTALEGASGHFVVSDEPPTRDKWIALTRGLIDFSGRAWIAATPIKASHFMAELMAEANTPGSSTELISISIDDNRKSRGGHLEDKAVDEFIRSLRPDELQSRLHGKPAHLAGAVFKAWEPRPPFLVDPFDIPESWPRMMAIDPSPRKPLAAVWIAISPDNTWYIYRDVYTDSLITIKQFSEYIKEVEGWTRRADGTWYQGADSEPVVLRLIDTSANTFERVGNATTRMAFGQHGISLMSAYKMGYMASIDKINEMIMVDETFEWSTGPQLVIFNNCPRVVHEFLNFVWQPESTQHKATGADPMEKPLKTNDDCVDCIRYMVMTNAKYHSLARMLRQGRDVW